MIIEGIFEKNCKFISQTELNADFIKRQFVKNETRDHIVIGEISLPTGKICVGDPLAYMCTGSYTPELKRTVKAGVYPVEIAVSRTPVASLRISTARVKFSGRAAVRYELAEPTPETAAFKCSDGDLTGFPVDAGMMAFMDSDVIKEYISFIDKWHKENPEGNHYDDYFEGKFADSYAKLPDYQRDGGDFIQWTIPDTDHSVVMLSSGFGDGFYQCYWGIDEIGEICELTVPLVNSDVVDEANKEFLDIWNGPEYCIVTKHIAEGGEIGYMCREEASESFEDSGWRFYGKNEDEEYWDNADNYVLYSIHRLADRFEKIIPLLRSPVYTAYFCTDDNEFIQDDFQE